MVFFSSRSKHLPPGPPGLPIVGNLRDIPTTDQWVYFYQQSQKYGSDVNMYKVFSETIIVLNSKKAIDALFTNKVQEYSSKPPRKMSQISDLTMTLPFMDPGDVFDNARKQFHMGIGSSAVNQYDSEYEAGSRQFIQKLASDLQCANLDKTIDDSLGHVFLKVSTGYSGKETESVLTQLNNLAHFAADVLGDKYQIFDTLPFLASLPTWVPKFGPMLKQGAQWKKELHAIANSTVRLMGETKGEGVASVMSSVCTAQGGTGAAQGDEQSNMIAVTMNAGGMLATESALFTFLLVMANNRETFQKRAQAEIDSVCGGRLPTMAERPKLPFVDAVLAEVLRWVSIAPVIAREVIEDDHYDGYLIPKGATIMANNWAISRDTDAYENPETFDPTRFLDASGQALRKDVLHPMDFAFGFGRRTCPGRFLADALLFSHFAHVLAVFDVALPDAGEKTRRKADAALKIQSNGAACRIADVYVKLAPRSEAATALINQNVPEASATATTPANGDSSAANGHGNGSH